MIAVMNTTLEKIKPETVALIEANAERFGLSVDDYLRVLLPKDEKNVALKADDNRQTNNESPEVTAVKREKSIVWIKSHRQEYGGLFVALDGDKLIAAGEKYNDVRKSAIQKGYKNAFIGDVLPIDYEGFIGGLD